MHRNSWALLRKSDEAYFTMKDTARIASVLNTKTLDQSITGFQTFHLGELDLPENVSIALPQNLRLGHLVEKIVGGLIRASHNYNLLHENIQLIEQKQTIGEIDFLIQNVASAQITHLELAYKFYLYDPGISTIERNNWIGPNRNDSLDKKLTKLKQKQFPILNHPAAREALQGIQAETVSQALCFLVSLFVPYQFQEELNAAYQNAILGYYVNFKTFAELNTEVTRYYIPPKKEWGIDPTANEDWRSFERVSVSVQKALTEKQSVLCWQKQGTAYQQFFVVWW